MNTLLDRIFIGRKYEVLDSVKDIYRGGVVYLLKVSDHPGLVEYYALLNLMDYATGIDEDRLIEFVEDSFGYRASALKEIKEADTIYYLYKLTT